MRIRIVRRTAAIAAALAALVPGLALIDAGVGGPYTHWHHERLMSKARAAGLIGQSEAAVVEALGEPDSLYTSHPGPLGERTVSYAYVAVPYLQLNPFQVWVRDGQVLCVESFDRETHVF